MGLPADVQERTYLCGLVHDIGKIGLPASLLLKDGPLTLEERRQMQEHPAIGEAILKKVDLYADVAIVVRHHHERIDGEGYPDRLPGDEIPLLSRIIAVADAYNAMTSNRAYRDAMPSRVARLRLAQAVESQFDTSAVAAFEAILAGASEEYRTAQRAGLRAELRRRRRARAWSRQLGTPPSAWRHPSACSAPPDRQRSRAAFIASAVRDRTPSLSNRCWTCTFTVPRDEEPAGDLPVREPCTEQVVDLALSRREGRARIEAAGDVEAHRRGEILVAARLRA